MCVCVCVCVCPHREAVYCGTISCWTAKATIVHDTLDARSSSAPNGASILNPLFGSTHTPPFNGPLSGTTRVGRYQKKHSPTHTHPDHRTSFIIFLHLQRSMASSLFSLRAWQSFSTTSLQVLFDLPLGLGPYTSYSMHFFAKSPSSFGSTCPYRRSLFCCNTNAMSSIYLSLQ